ncbi:MAG: ECF RNA polymerase sigma factor SigW [Chloroflexi bacterium]|nr:ECF RNA polymerase sigma factor SigW [Chloroflexota bacterium]
MPKTDTLPSELLAKAARGDRRAFGEFYELHRDEIYRYIFFRISKNQHIAEDLTGKVFLEAWESLHRKKRQKKTIKNLRAWIYRIAHNKIVDHYRTRKFPGSLEDHQEQFLLSDEVEYEVGQGLLSQVLAEGIDQLSPTYQQVIILRFINQVSHAEVAEILDIKEGHARVLQYRALKKLRRLIPEVHKP